jgi:hypothetical protein
MIVAANVGTLLHDIGFQTLGSSGEDGFRRFGENEQ